MNLAVETKKKELEKLYRKLGESAVDLLEDVVVPDELKSLLVKVREKRNELNNEIELYCRANKVKVCPCCGVEMELENIFCVECGAKVEAALGENEKQCSKCGKIISSDSRFCTYCGAEQ